MKRKFFGTLYNTYSFFTLYTNLDGFKYEEANVPLEKRPEIELKREFMNELLKFEALFNNRKSFKDQWLSIFK